MRDTQWVVAEGVTVLNLCLLSTQDAFDDLALFFYDKHGGEVIAVLWKPLSFQPQPFKVSFWLCFKLCELCVYPESLKGFFFFSVGNCFVQLSSATKPFEKWR